MNQRCGADEVRRRLRDASHAEVQLPEVVVSYRVGGIESDRLAKGRFC